MTERIAHLLAAASHAQDRSVRLVYLAEGRALFAHEAERHRELALLLESLERELARMTQTKLPGADP